MLTEVATNPFLRVTLLLLVFHCALDWRRTPVTETPVPLAVTAAAPVTVRDSSEKSDDVAVTVLASNIP